MYGKTSDKDIYGAILPATVNRGILKTDASEKNERFQLASNKYPYDFDDKFNELIKKAKIKPKPATSTFNFIKYDGFKPISESNDPETYKYLQYLEGIDKEHENLQVNPKDTEAYKSIQDILDAHEKNQGKNEEHKLSDYRKNDSKKLSRNRNGGHLNGCVRGRCKKRNNSIRIGTRPYVTRIKHRYV